MIRRLQNINTKSSSPQFSNEIYTVVYPNGNNLKLSLLDIEKTNIPTYQPRQQRSTAGKPPKKLTYAVIQKRK